MAGSTTKKALIRRYEKETLAGYINPVSYLQPGGVELLSAEGNIASVPYAEIKTISFVRDFESAIHDEKRLFNTRPKMEGLWASFHFRDGEVMEGILPNNVLQWEYQGFTVIPPDPGSNNHRIFIPRASLRSVEILGVVGSPLKKRKPKSVPAGEQPSLFDE